MITTRTLGGAVSMALLLAVGLAAVPAGAQEDVLPWEEEAPAAPTDNELIAEALKHERATSDGVEVDGEGDLALLADELGSDDSSVAPPAERAPKVRAAPGIDVSAFEDLLKENISLRREITQTEAQLQLAEGDRHRLEAEIRDLERQVGESVALVQDLRRRQADAASDPVAGITAADTGAEADALRAEVRELRDALATARDENAGLRGQLDQARAELVARAAVSPAPQAGSDLYRSLEEESALLKRQLEEARNATAQATRQRDADQASAGAAGERLAEVEQRLADALQLNERLQATVDSLVERVPGMEREVSTLRESVEVKSRDLATRDRELENLRLEMERREDRLRKAERRDALMVKTREEAQRISKKEQRDLHFNMAGVYAREGRMAEAEQEYLHALRVDPTDAGSHFNLGILYEESLNQPRKAAMHYRAYIKLAPNADDVDEVKGWIMQLELQ